MTDVFASDSSMGIIPQVPGFAWGDWPALQAALTNGVRLDFAQPWLEELAPDFKPGHVWLGINDEHLVAYSVLQDD